MYTCCLLLPWRTAEINFTVMEEQHEHCCLFFFFWILSGLWSLHLLASVCEGQTGHRGEWEPKQEKAGRQTKDTNTIGDCLGSVTGLNFTCSYFYVIHKKEFRASSIKLNARVFFRAYFGIFSTVFPSKNQMCLQLHVNEYWWCSDLLLVFFLFLRIMGRSCSSSKVYKSWRTRGGSRACSCLEASLKQHWRHHKVLIPALSSVWLHWNC